MVKEGEKKTVVTVLARWLQKCSSMLVHVSRASVALEFDDFAAAVVHGALMKDAADASAQVSNDALQHPITADSARK